MTGWGWSIWDEKPMPFLDETFESNHNGELLYEADEMDAWLKELKEEWDAILKHHISQEEGYEKQIRELKKAIVLSTKGR